MEAIVMCLVLVTLGIGFYILSKTDAGKKFFD